MVGDPGIEPGMGLPGGVTVRCRTLQHVARAAARGQPTRRVKYLWALVPSTANWDTGRLAMPPRAGQGDAPTEGQ